METSDRPIDGAWTMEQLLDAELAGDRLKFVFFWGHTPQIEDKIGHHVFSQWWQAPFLADEIEYPTAEHFMMAEKARLFDDQPMLQEILQAATPAEAKALGRKVSSFDQDTWIEHRLDIVTRASIAKFDSTAELRAYLVGTGDRVLVEASPRDRIWGIGMGKNNEKASTPSAWRGRNLLGFALMQARAVLAGRVAA